MENFKSLARLLSDEEAYFKFLQDRGIVQSQRTSANGHDMSLHFGEGVQNTLA
jgi:hypothetical protein